MPGPKPPAFETLSLHAGQHPDPVTGARAVPIYQTTSYVFQDADHAAACSIWSAPGTSTPASPTRRRRSWRNGWRHWKPASAPFARRAAWRRCISPSPRLLSAGDHIVASASLYGGTINLLTHTLPRFGIATTFVKPRDLDGFRAAIRPNTRLVIAETIGNPGLEVLDIPKVADIAHAAGVPLLIDNTFATPYLSRPIELGADLVMHSITKWIGGHGIAIGGVIVDGGRFDFQASGKFPTITEPYAGYHGIVFGEEFGPSAFIMRARAEGLRDFGACLSPTNAFHLLQGVETLAVRMQRHMENTAAVLDFLTKSKAVDWVLHPSLESHPDYELAQAAAAEGSGLDHQLRHQGRPRGGAEIHRGAAARQPSRQCRRRQDPGHPSGQHHAPADGRGATQGRRIWARSWCGSRSASRRRATSSTIWRRRCAPRRGRERCSSSSTVRRRLPPPADAISTPRCRSSSSCTAPALDHTVWALLARWFAHRGFAVLAPDLPGHGRSDGEPLASIGAMADWTAALIDAAGARQRRAHRPLHGVAGRARDRRAPSREGHRASGLIGAAAAMPVSRDLLAAAEADDHAAIDMVRDLGIRLPRRHRRLARARPMDAGRRRAPARTSPSRRAVHGSRACNDYRDGLAAAAKVTVPATLVLGERDLMTPAKAGLELAAALPNARVVTLKGAGHMLMSERPDEVLAAVREFSRA